MQGRNTHYNSWEFMANFEVNCANTNGEHNIDYKV